MANKVTSQPNSAVLKLLPQSVEAEEAVLGAILVNPVSLGRIVEYIKPESFYKPAHRLIYETMLELFKKNEPIDIVTVSESLRNEEKLEDAGGRAYINDLALNVVTTANIEFYAKIIQEKEIKRALINAGSEIVSMSYENEETDIVLDNAQNLIFNIAAQKDSSDLVPIQDLVVSSYEQREFRYNNSSRMLNYIPIVGIDGIPECLEEINNYGIFATVMQNPQIQAQTLCSVSSNIISGKSPLDGLHFNIYNDKYIVIPYIPVNKSNIDTAIKIYK